MLDTPSLPQAVLGLGMLMFWLRVEHRLTKIQTRLNGLPCKQCDANVVHLPGLSSIKLPLLLAPALILLISCAPLRPLTPGRIQISTLTQKKGVMNLQPSAAVDLITPESPSGQSRILLTETRTIQTIAPGSQHDTSRTTAARAAALAPVQWLGLALIIAGLAMFTPWLRPLIRSTTTPFLSISTGIGLLILASVLIEHALLIGAAAFAAVVIWFLAHRHGQLKQQATDTNTQPTPPP